MLTQFFCFDIICIKINQTTIKIFRRKKIVYQIFTVILIGLSLSMDAFAAAAASGACESLNCKKVSAMKCPALFALFQGGMTLLGFLIGSLLIGFIQNYAYWIAFGLLAFIGGKMIIDAFHEKAESCLDYSSNKVLLILAFATSIDAFAVGLSITIEDFDIYISSSIIAAVTFIMCLIGVKLGRFVGKKFQKSALVIGGIILIGLSLKILIEGLFF